LAASFFFEKKPKDRSRAAAFSPNPHMEENDKEPSDADLVAHASAGSDAAFTTLFRRYYDRVHAFVFRIVLIHAAAEDITQETFIRAARGLGGMRAGQAFAAWLFRIATHAAGDYLRKERSQQRRADGLRAESLTESLPTEPSDTQAERARVALEALPPRQRAAVALVFFENCSHAEAAQRLGCAESTVSWRIFLAKRALRKRLTR
jgi:RNA polymerase sigma-70 factor (ECF subfamily)